MTALQLKLLENSDLLKVIRSSLHLDGLNNTVQQIHYASSKYKKQADTFFMEMSAFHYSVGFSAESNSVAVFSLADSSESVDSVESTWRLFYVNFFSFYFLFFLVFSSKTGSVSTCSSTVSTIGSAAFFFNRLILIRLRFCFLSLFSFYLVRLLIFPFEAQLWRLLQD